MNETRKRLRNLGKIIKNELRKEIQLNDLKSTGKLSSRIKFSTKELKNKDVLTIKLPFYAEYLDRGTSASRKRFVNIAAISEWAKTKSNFSSLKKTDFKKAVGAISASIASKGIIKRFRGGSKFIDNVLESVDPLILQEISEAKVQEILNEIK